MHIQKINSVQNNNPTFGFNIATSQKVKQCMHIKDTAYAIRVLDMCKEFKPGTTIKLSLFGAKFPTIVAENLNNNECIEKEINSNQLEGQEIYNFLESLMKQNKFWENAKPSALDIDNHSIFVNDAVLENQKNIFEGIKTIVMNQKDIVDGLSHALRDLSAGCRPATVQSCMDEIRLSEIKS